MSRRWFLPLLSLFLVVLAVLPAAKAAAADPRHFDATPLGGRVDLGREWLFAPDDRPVYAGAKYDDSGWRVVLTDRALASYGYQNLPYCWYRLHARLRSDARQLAVLVGATAGAYELYANGVRLGGVGNMDAHSMLQHPGIIAYPIPDQALAASPGQLVLALRFSNEIRRYQIRTLDNPLVQASVFLESQEATSRDVSYDAAHDEEVRSILGGLNLLIGLVALALYLAMRTQREYLAIGTVCMAAAADAGLQAWEYLSGFSVGKIALNKGFEAIQPLAIIEFVRLILKLPRSRMWLVMEAVVIVGPVITPLVTVGRSPISVIFAAYFSAMLVMDVVLPALLLRAWWRGNTDARVLVPAFLLSIFADYYSFVRQVMYFFHFPLTSEWSLHIGSYSLSGGDLGSIAFSITILLFIVLRTIRIARERAQAAGEIEAARTTQQLLLARVSQSTPGFTVESVYLPASEVGGDFFLVSPDADGSLLAIVGDVSGKGLIAAMRVSMILGVLRREDSREPAVILNQLNEALLSQGEMGFTTACCVRLEHSGGYTIANAGHISPYSNGLEIATPPGLPLGLASQSEYETISGAIHPGEKLVLMSDGVVEARSPKGELYGFDRLPALTRMNADEIANTAQRFGQEDDITVLTIACCV